MNVRLFPLVAPLWVLALAGLVVTTARAQDSPSITFTPLTNGQEVVNLSAIGGTVADADGIVISVTFSIHELDPVGGPGRWWNGSAWQALFNNLAATVSGTNWAPAVMLPSLNGGNSYQLEAIATDNSAMNGSTNITVQTACHPLTWDPGTTHAGTAVFNHPNTLGGNYCLKIVTSNTTVGAWRTALNVTSGEADVYMSLGAPPTTSSYYFKSDRAGSDGFVLHSSRFMDNQEWYLLVVATVGAEWNLISGEVFVQDLGVLASDGSSGSGSVAMGAEGMRFFKTTIPTDTQAWRLWANGLTNDILVKKSFVPHPVGGWEMPYPNQPLPNTGQILVVPPYFSGVESTVYFIGMSGAPGTTLNLDSRKQAITDLTFNTTTNVSVTGFGYTTYRVQVPIEQIAWEITAVPVSGDPNVAMRRNEVPNEYVNTAYSDLNSTTVADSFTLVPPTLSDGTFYITTYGVGAHSFTLVNRLPVVTEINFTDTKVNDDPNRVGWRIYRITDIDQQLGHLGWDLFLQNFAAGTELAMRRNAVPGRWRSRSEGGAAHVDVSGPEGFIQRLGHQADIWYVGAYHPTTSLGAFTLVVQPLTNDFLTFNTGSKSRSNVPANHWEYFRVDVPVGVLGWDIRLASVTAGSPLLVVRRELLPDGISTSLAYPHVATSWPHGNQWAAGYDWTGWPQSPSGVSELRRILEVGLNNPLEPATYYVGVIDQSGTSSYTLQSRGIGTGQTIPVTTLAFSGSSSNSAGLAPREADYFKVTIPPNTRNWQLKLTPTAPGEALLLVKKDVLPNVGTGEYPDSGKQMQKLGKEHFVLLPDNGETYLMSGDYYLAVASEGEAPGDGRIGSGNVAYTLQGLGELAVDNLGTLPAPGGPDLVRMHTLEGGQLRAYQFTVPEGTLSFEARLEDRVGNPVMTLRSGDLFPTATDGYGVSGGSAHQYAGPELISVANPTNGTWTVMVKANADLFGGGSYPDASYTLRVKATAPTLVTFDGGIATETNQPGNTWKYFCATVPPGALGWDIRLVNVTNGSPRMVVRRALLPERVSTEPWGDPYAATEWPSNYQWGAIADWTGYTYSPEGSNEVGRIIVVGTGNPLEPGAYYIGVTGGDTNDLSYTVQSRGIGSGLSLPVATLSFSGGMSNRVGLAAREADYFCVVVPPGQTSWRLRLAPTSPGDAMLLVDKGVIPNVGTGSAFDQGDRLQKLGNEHFVLLPTQCGSTLDEGTYYLAVVSEGEGATNSMIGAGSVDYTLQSLGPLTVDNLGTLGGVGAPDLQRLGEMSEAGQTKAYQFTVPPGAIGMEVELEALAGIPVLLLRAGPDLPGFSSSYYGTSGGCEATYAVAGTSLITIATPTPGVWSVVIQASFGFGAIAIEDATYNLRVRATGPTALAFDGGTATVSGQPAGTWRYFQVEVPANALGWDVRLVNVAGGEPRGMVVRRGELPAGLGTFPWVNPSVYATWPSGYHWGAGSDWTGYPNDAAGNYAHVNMLAMGMGNPLEPGTYFIGVNSQSGMDALSYTVQSRGIGSGFVIPVGTLNFSGAGSSVSASEIDARQAVYYRIEVPPNTPSWRLKLTPDSGETLLMVHKNVLPNVLGSHGPATQLNGGSKMQKAGNEHYLLLPDDGQSAISDGTYYLAVVSEGVNPSGNNNIGTGTSDFTLASLGALPVQNLGGVGGGGAPDVTQPDLLEGGQIKAYQFTVPAGARSLEVRLADREGNPVMTLRGGAALAYGGAGYGNDGGENPAWGDPDLITIPNVAPGTYSLMVQASSDFFGFPPSYPNASFTIRVRQHPIPELNFASNLNTNGLSHTASGLLSDDQHAFFKVNVPAMNNGQAVLGWKLDVITSQGAATVRVRKDLLPEYSPGYNGTSSSFAPSGILVPNYLTQGVWYVEVRGAGATEFILTSSQLLLERSAWNMPMAGQPVTTPGLPPGGSLFGDTGVETNGVPLADDQGTDLAQGAFHYYAVTVPSNNAGLMRVQLEAISGNPNLYARVQAAPSLMLGYDRAMVSFFGTEYANWVPLNGRYESYLPPGTWYLAVEAAGNSNVRYRMRLSTGNVTDLALEGGSLTGQILAAGDWRYYRVSIPADAPRNWHVTFSQELGDVVMHVRDITPPGQGGDWSSDYKNNGPYGNFDLPGTYTFTTPPLRPGHTYYVGFRAQNDATFSVSSATSGGTIGPCPRIDFCSGRVTNTIPAFGSVRYCVDVPADAERWVHTSTHSFDVQVRIEQGTLPFLNFNDDSASFGENSSLDQNLTFGWPWVPGQTYYIVATNTGFAPQTFVFRMHGVGGGCDNTPPTITCPTNVTVQCDADAPPNFAGGSVSDNIDPTPTVTHEGDVEFGFNPRTIRRTYKATDATGNMATCEQTITVHDTVPPSIICPTNLTVQCFADVPPPNPASVMTSDNCDPSPTVDYLGDMFNGSCPLTITRTYRARDDIGNTATCTQTITVHDTNSPVLTGCPTNVTYQCPTDVPFQANVTALDNCDGALPVSFSETQSNPGSSCSNVITRTWTATDSCSNTATCTQTITVNDSMPPGITCPPDVTTTVDPGQCTASGVFLGMPTTADNCGVAGVSNNAPAAFPIGMTTVTWTVTDTCSNTATCTQKVTVNDAQPPVITAQPQSRTNSVGTTALFSVTATSCGPITYQWCFGINALAGETNSTLTITDVQPDDAGTYAVKLTNSAGTRTSAPAVLTVTDDSDNDGLPDRWEFEHFDDLDEDGDSDFDEDGQSNLGEYLSGTDPTDPASRLAFISITRAPLTGHITLRWQSVAGKTYQLQFKTALGDPEWVDLGDEITATAPETSYEDTTVGLAQSRFYGLVLVP